LGYGCDEFARIRNSHRTEEVSRRIGLSVDQKLSGKILLREGGEEISVKNRKVKCRMQLMGEKFT
jgi:hypothetical protein